MDLALCDVQKLIDDHGGLGTFVTMLDLQHVCSSLTTAEPYARTIAKQACDGLQYLHGLGIMHRDVKPGVSCGIRIHPSCTEQFIIFQNLLVFSRNPTFVKLADFGLARRIAGDTALQVSHRLVADESILK